MGDTLSVLGMRDSYFEALFKVFQADRDCVIITADNGAPSLDQFRGLPGQFYTVGIAEQAMATIATGLAREGKKVWIYAIAPFVTTRIHEFVKLDFCAMRLPVTILGVGAGLAYDNMGPSHHTLEDISIMRAIPGLEIYSPADSACAAALAELPADRPRYIRLDRAGLVSVWSGMDDLPRAGYDFVRIDTGPVIITTGVMVQQALKVAARLGALSVVDVYRLAPFAVQAVFDDIDGEPFITLEEHFLPGGLGSIVSESLHDAGMTNRLLRIGLPHDFVFAYGGREAIWKKNGLDVESIAKKITEWL